MSLYKLSGGIVSMISVYESITNWLSDILTQILPDYTVIETENVTNWLQFGNSALLNSPNEIVTPLMGGQRKHTEFKTFFLKRQLQDSDERKDYEVIKDKLMDIIYNKNINYEFPDDGRDWKEISLNGGIYPVQKDENNNYADYMIPLKLIFIL